MPRARFRFYAQLNDLLPPEQRGRDTVRMFDVSGTVKDFIESFGVPHTEVDLVLVNGESAGFSRPVRDGDHVSVYPAFTRFDVSALSRVRPAGSQTARFVLDVHLGRLTAYLRMAGFDAVYRNHASDAELARLSGSEDRILLTRDRYLLMRNEVRRGYWLRSTEPREQFVEVLRRYKLAGAMQPFTRCMECNHMLEPAGRESVIESLPATVLQHASFHRCPGCGRVYWEGSHHRRMKELLGWAAQMA
jgi:uncharacterized protein with PIN domain